MLETRNQHLNEQLNACVYMYICINTYCISLFNVKVSKSSLQKKARLVSWGLQPLISSVAGTECGAHCDDVASMQQPDGSCLGASLNKHVHIHIYIYIHIWKGSKIDAQSSCTIVRKPWRPRCYGTLKSCRISSGNRIIMVQVWVVQGCR